MRGGDEDLCLSKKEEGRDWNTSCEQSWVRKLIDLLM